uniref:Potassium channel domain-containing protein n=2 Tax=Parascaris TaxID=6254 RepID=A0A915B704_PARUN
MDSNRTRTPNGDYTRKASMSRARSAEPLRKETTLPANLINSTKRNANISSSVAGDLATPAMNGSKPFNVNEEAEKPHRRRRRRKRIEVIEDKPKNTPPPQPPKRETKGGRTIWRNIVWLIILFAYSLAGGIAFSAIEGGNDRTDCLKKYERELDIYEGRIKFQDQLLARFREVEYNITFNGNRTDDKDGVDVKLHLMREAIAEYERRLGIEVKEPIMTDTKWNLWGGVYYSASLYTTIGYGNFFPKTQAGQIFSMVYAFCGIPLVFTILLEWGFLYFIWIEIFWKWFNQKLCFNSMEAHLKKRIAKERLRRAGSELSLRSTSVTPFMKNTIQQKDAIHQTDHQIESGKRIAQLEIELSEAEKQRTVPLKAALIFFFLWILISAFIVRLWERNWTYFTAYYYFFTSLTTIGLGDVVTETPNFIIFNLALTMVGLSVVGLCIAIVQAKIRLIFDRMIRSIDSQYRIRQIDPDVATMTLITDEKEGIKRLCEAQPIQDRIIFIAMDEHKKQLLADRWKQKSNMINRITQTWPNRADKCIQTGQRVDEQPRAHPEGEYGDEWEEVSIASDESTENEYDEDGKRVVPPSTRRYIYTVFD